MNGKIKTSKTSALCAAFLIAFFGGWLTAQTKPDKTYSQTLARHVRLMNEQLRAVSDYKKYFVKAEIINDNTDLIVTPKSSWWSRADDARRAEITKDWLIRWAAKRRGYEAEKAVLSVTVADGEDVFGCTQQPDGTIGCS